MLNQELRRTVICSVPQMEAVNVFCRDSAGVALNVRTFYVAKE